MNICLYDESKENKYLSYNSLLIDKKIQSLFLRLMPKNKIKFDCFFSIDGDYKSYRIFFVM